MPAQLSFIPQVLRLTPLFFLCRGILLLCKPCTRRKTTPLHELGLMGFWLYLSAVCYITVNVVRIIHGYFEMGHNHNVTPFAEIAGIAAGGDMLYAMLNILGNVAMFFPLGFSLPLLWRGWSGRRVLGGSLLLSGTIELLQLLTGRGADIDDVILNALGAGAGFLGCCIVRAIAPKFTTGFRLREKAVRPRKNPKQPGGETPVQRPAAGRGGWLLPGKGGRGIAFTGTISALCVLITGAVLLGAHAEFSLAGGSPLCTASNGEEAAQLVLDLPPVNSTTVLLVSAESAQPLCARGAEQRIYPASMTKIMTATLALEVLEDLQEQVPVREEIFADIYADNLSTAGFQPGEEAAALDLVYGVLLPSGAECSIALAERIAGSEEAFAALMNEKARELGMSGTHFANATGRHHPDHYTTAGDLMILFRYALDNPSFRTIIATERHGTSPTNLHPDGITFTSTLLGGAADIAFPGGRLVGGKTGYTDQAGQCLASLAEIGGREYMLITAGAVPEDFRVQQLHIDDALAIYGALGLL